MMPKETPKRPKLYVAGPISGLPDLNRMTFRNCTKRLRDLGYLVVNPHEICFDLNADLWTQCMRRCISKLMECDLIILLPGWQNSKGANMEVNLARQLGMMAIEVEDFIKLDHNYD